MLTPQEKDVLHARALVHFAGQSDVLEHLHIVARYKNGEVWTVSSGAHGVEVRRDDMGSVLSVDELLEDLHARAA